MSTRLTRGKAGTVGRSENHLRGSSSTVFESLSDRLSGALKGLRGKGRLTEADIINAGPRRVVLTGG